MPQAPTFNASQKNNQPPYPNSAQNVQFPSYGETEEPKNTPTEVPAAPKVEAPQAASAPPTAPKATKNGQPEFDFAESNAKFSKEAIAKESSSVIPPKEEFYNKTSSFFDNISSTTKERFEGSDNNMTGYQRRGEERKLNMETFGQESLYNNNNNGNSNNNRGRGRGGRGRGGQYWGGNRGYGNRGGRGNYNNGYNQFQQGGYQQNSFNQGGNQQNFEDKQ